MGYAMLKQDEFDEVEERTPLTPETLNYSELNPSFVLPRDIFLNYLKSASKKFADDIPDWAGWFLVAVVSGREYKLAELLSDVGLDTWVPETTEKQIVRERNGWKRPGRKRKIKEHEVRILVYNGFILCRFVPSPEAWHAITSFKGVIGVVSGGNCFNPATPAQTRLKSALSANAVERLQDLQGEVQSPDSHTQLKVNEKVKVTRGPFAGFPATGTGKPAAFYTAWVNVEIFGRSTPVLLEEGDFERVS